jgi:hypothetical protein
MREEARWVVPEEGLEPTQPCGYRILSPARLPIPPLRQGSIKQVSTPTGTRSSNARDGLRRSAKVSVSHSRPGTAGVYGRGAREVALA